MTRQLPPAYFLRDGDTFVPTSMAQGPWGSSISGNFVGGLLGHAIESAVSDPDLQPARLTVDLLRPAAMEPVRVRTSVVREGRRLTLVDAEVVQADKVVSRASAVLLRRGEQPPGTVWTTPVAMPPLPPPDQMPSDTVPLWVLAYGKDPNVAGAKLRPDPVAARRPEVRLAAGRQAAHRRCAPDRRSPAPRWRATSRAPSRTTAPRACTSSTRITR